MKFSGYKRPDGKIGIRNYVLILPTCNCSSETCRMVADMIDGTVTFTNQNGCSQTQDDVQYTIDILSGFAANPNVYGTIIIGNGCEVCEAERIYDNIRKRTNKPLHKLVIQECGGTEGTVKKASELARKLVQESSLLHSELYDLSHLIVGTECGGSDATSGIAANPCVGRMSDRLVEKGGTVILSETTEFMGAERILAERAVNEKVAARIFEITERYENYLKNLNTDLRGTNPAPGNKKGGITTLEEKSLGCIYKGGSTKIQAVYEYAEEVTEHGLVIMDTPGADSASLCGMAAGGAQIAVFTTGRGTPIGNPVIPVIKVTGNQETYKKMHCNMDFDASPIITDNISAADNGDELFELVVKVANGYKTQAEIFKMREVGIARLCNYV